MTGIGIGINESKNQYVKRPPATLEFDGVNDYVYLGDAHEHMSSFNCSSGQFITISAWFYTEKTTTGYRTIVNRSSGGTHYILSVINNTVNFLTFTANNNINIPFETIINKWNHVAITYDGTTLRGYANGTLTGEVVTANAFRTGGQTYIGIRGYSSNEFFDGEIKDVCFWDKALSASEIQTNMNNELVGNEVGLIGYWKLDEGAGTGVRNIAGNNSLATINGGATWKPSPILALPSYVDWDNGYPTAYNASIQVIAHTPEYVHLITISNGVGFNLPIIVPLERAVVYTASIELEILNGVDDVIGLHIWNVTQNNYNSANFVISNFVLNNRFTLTGTFQLAAGYVDGDVLALRPAQRFINSTHDNPFEWKIYSSNLVIE